MKTVAESFAIAVAILCMNPATAGPRVNVFVNAGGYSGHQLSGIRSGGFYQHPGLLFSQPSWFLSPGTACIPTVSYWNFSSVRSSPAGVTRAPLVSTGITVPATPFGWRR